MNETIYFEQDGVQVTNARFKVDAQTYAVRNITSTAAWTKPQRWLGALLCAVIGLMAVSGGRGGFGVAGFFLLLAAVLYWTGRPWHFVLLSTASGEVKALKSRERDYILRVVNALNDAMVSQHRAAQ